LIQLPDKPAYRNFANAKNAALQSLLLKARQKTSDELRKFMVNVQAEVAKSYPMMGGDITDHSTIQQIRNLDASIDRHAYAIALEMGTHWTVLRAQAFALAHAAEQQAILNVKNGDAHRVPQDAVLGAAYNDEWGVPRDRAYLELSKLRREVISKVEMSLILKSPLSEAIPRIMSVFPRPQRAVRPKVMPKIKEADYRDPEDEDGFGLSDFLSEDEWKRILYDYQKEFIPSWRDPRVDVSDLPAEESIYLWKLEQDMTSDFVKSVRDGEHEGAKKQGITDFVWIAVLGSHGTSKEDACEYCYKRDGFTTREIEAKLNKEWAGDPEWSRKSVPSLHPNCYCRLAPATDELPESPDTGEADFEKWLNS